MPVRGLIRRFIQDGFEFLGIKTTEYNVGLDVRSRKEIENGLKKGSFDSKSIIQKLKIDWNAHKVTSFLKKNNNIEIIKGKPLKFVHKDRDPEVQATLF